MSKQTPVFEKLDGSGLRIGVVVSRWNGEMTDALFMTCKQGLVDSGVQEKNIIITSVPGSFELVFGAKRLIETVKPDAVIAIGCLIKGETSHSEYIARAVSQGIMRVNIETDTPVIFGVLTCLDKVQAEERSLGEGNLGYEWGRSAVEMGLFGKPKN